MKSEIKRKVGRPKSTKPIKDNVLMIRLENMELEELKILQRDINAETMTALIRHLITMGAFVQAEGKKEFLGSKSEANAIYYQRFLKKWDCLLSFGVGQ